MSGIFTTVRQQGKSSLVAAYNDWVQESERPKEYLEFNTDPLALVCAMLRAGKEYYAIASTLQGVGTRTVLTDTVITDEDKEYAQRIRKHFRNKILMRRLKNMNISKFMQAVDEILETPLRIEKDSVSPLMKLPDFYEEDKVTEALFAEHTSVPARNVKGLDTTLEYAGTVKRRTSRTKVDMQYWRAPSNHLVRVIFPLHDMGRSAWECFAKHGKIKINTISGGVSKVTGYDYFVYQLGADYEVELLS